jgi:hypothetical protein
MPNVLNPIVDMYRTQLEASRRFADVMFSGTEKIDRVVIEATHHAFTEQLNFAQAVASARDPKGVANVQSTFFSRRPESTVTYQKEIMRIFAEIQNEIGRSMQEYAEKLGTNVANNAAAPLKVAQEQATDTVFNPMTGMFSVWESAFKEVASLANRNMAAARSSYESAAEAATTATQAAARAASDATQLATSAASDVSEAATSVTINGGGTPSQSSPHIEGGEVVEDKKPQTGGGSRRK